MVTTIALRLTAALLLALAAAHAQASSNVDHRKQLLETKTCQQCNLQGADLRGSKLEDADLSEANLKGANLREANLKGLSSG